MPVLFAVQTTHRPAVYEAKLAAEFDTWLHALAPESRIVVGPQCGSDAPCENELWSPSVGRSDEANLKFVSKRSQKLICPSVC